MAARVPQKRRTARSRQRGVALLIVITAIAVLTAVAADFAYNSRVDLQLAANQRDEVRAFYLAKSGIALSRLVLKFQKQIDSTPIPNLGQLAGLMGGGQQQPGAQQPASTLNLQIWRMVRVDCHMLRGMVRDDEAEAKPETSMRAKSRLEFDEEFPEVAQGQQRRSFGGFEGCFDARISDEEERINLTRLDAPQLSSQAVVQSLLDLMTDKRFEFLFEKEDQNGVKVTPQDVLINMHDWIDEDEVQSSLNLTGQGDTFLKGFTDENGGYDRYEPRYRAKNARFDSLDELYLVHGVNDAFMAAFRDRLTVYPDINAKLNVNTDDPLMLATAIRAVADPSHPDPRLLDPVFVDHVIEQIRTARLYSFFGMSVLDFVNVVQAAGVRVNESIRNNVQNNRWVNDKSTTYRIESVGEAGSVQKRITAVVRLDDGLGRLVYWREE